MKKGISLIVLVITIIVIIILAGAVILSISQNNPIAQANTAVTASDIDAVQAQITMYASSIMTRKTDEIKFGTKESSTFTELTTATTFATVGADGTATAGTVNYKCADEEGVLYDSTKITLPKTAGVWKIDQFGNVTFAKT